jgi:hypothetical protein
MVIRYSRLSIAMACAAIVTILWISHESFVQAQPPKSKVKSKPITPAELKKLDSKLEDVQRSFLKDTESIIKGYEEGGQFERAKILLEVLRKLDPKNEQIKKKLEQLDDQILDSSEFEMDLDPGKPWQQVGIVVKDHLLRIEAEGDYKFVASLPVNAEGFPSKDPANEMVGGAPLGAVVAIILPPNGSSSAAPAGGNNNRDQKPNAFHVGAKYEQPTPRDGILLIKVNVPPGSKCTGKLKVKVGGVTRST